MQNLSQNYQNNALTWSQKVHIPQISTLGHFVQIWKISRVLVSLEVRPNMALTRSRYGPDMAPLSLQTIDMGERPFILSHENIRALACLEVKLGQRWSIYGPKIWALNRHRPLES